MGNQVAVDSVPVELPLSFNGNNHRVESKRNNLDSNIKLWQLWQPDDEPSVFCDAVPFTLKRTFDPGSCYLVAHTYRKDSLQRNQQVPSRIHNAINNFASSSFECFTPRGLAETFARGEGKSTGSLGYCIYVWNGKRAGNLARATTTAKGIELETQLRSDPKILTHLFNAGEPVSLATCFRDDIADAAPNKQRRLLNGCHLVKQLYYDECCNFPGLCSPSILSAAYLNCISFNSLLESDDVDIFIDTNTFSQPPSTAGSLSDEGSELATSSLRTDSSGSSFPRQRVSNAPTPNLTLSLSSLSKNQDAEVKNPLTALPNASKPQPKISLGLDLRKLNGNENTSVNTPRSAGGRPNRTDSETDLSLRPTSPSLKLGLDLKKIPLTTSTPTEEVPLAPRRNSGDRSSLTTSLKLFNGNDENSSFGARLNKHCPVPLDLSSVCERDESLVDPGKDREVKLAKYTKIPSQIEPYLFVGADQPAQDAILLKRHGITHIINAAAMVCNNYHPHDFEYTAVNLLDSPDEDIVSVFPVLISTIEHVRCGGGKVYVHCHQGVSRSCTIVIAYLMWKHGLTYEQGYQKVRDIRPICSPNSGFIAGLLRFQKQLSPTPQIQLFRLSPFTLKYPVPFVLREEASIGFNPTELNRNKIHCLQLDPRTGYALICPDKVHLWRGSECPQAAYEELVRLLPEIQTYFFTNRSDAQLPLPSINLQGSESAEFMTLLRRLHSDVRIHSVEKFDSLYSPSNFNTFLTAQHAYRSGIPLVDSDDISLEIAPATPEAPPKPKIEMYSYPKIEEMPNFDSDDLWDDTCRLIIRYTSNSSELFIWMGVEFIVEGSVDEYAQRAANDLQRYMNCSPIKNIKVIFQNEETEEFDDLFESG